MLRSEISNLQAQFDWLEARLDQVGDGPEPSEEDGEDDDEEGAVGGGADDEEQLTKEEWEEKLAGNQLKMTKDDFIKLYGTTQTKHSSRSMTDTYNPKPSRETTD